MSTRLGVDVLDRVQNLQVSVLSRQLQFFMGTFMCTLYFGILFSPFLSRCLTSLRLSALGQRVALMVITQCVLLPVSHLSVPQWPLGIFNIYFQLRFHNLLCSPSGRIILFCSLLVCILL